MCTEKLYYKNEYIKEFDAVVLDCRAVDKGFYAVLDKTAFFPEGGGQKADTGFIGMAKVTDVHEENGVIKHFVDRELKIGESYGCSLEWDKRFSRMQNHSGEHIISGLAHSLYGCENVGFHMDEDCMTVDFDKELTAEELDLIEQKANRAVYDNKDIICYFPNEKELANIVYRSKLDITENVRLVNIVGVDLCACCAPHVLKTGEIGVIKITDFMRHRGGIRITVKCGSLAFSDYCHKHTEVRTTSELLSAKQYEISKAVERLLNENDLQKHRFKDFKFKVAENCFNNFKTVGQAAYYISEFYDADMARFSVNRGMNVYELCVVFFGDDETGYSYIAGSNSMNLKPFVDSLNANLNGRGGGRGTMVQGKVLAVSSEISAYFQNTESLSF